MKKKKTYKYKSARSVRSVRIPSESTSSGTKRAPKTMQAKEPQAPYLLMKTPKYIPEINPAVFWDVPKENIDYTKNSYFIINRVFNYGNFQEVADIIICYGKEYVKKILLSSIDLDIFGLDKASAFLGIPEKQFQCYERIQYRLNS